MEVSDISPTQQAAFDELKRFGALAFWFGTIMNNKKMYDVTRNRLREYIGELRSKNIITTDTEAVKTYSLARHFGRVLVISKINECD